MEIILTTRLDYSVTPILLSPARLGALQWTLTLKLFGKLVGRGTLTVSIKIVISER